MTFVLSQISRLGVFIAADSSEKIIRRGVEPKFRECRKIHYLDTLNIGVATWGSWPEGPMDVDSFIKVVEAEYSEQPSNCCSDLIGFSDFLAVSLDRQLGFDGSLRNTDLYTGFHICGYAYPSSTPLPGFCNVFIEPDYTHFESQKTELVHADEEVSQLTNGIYRPFAAAREHLYKASKWIEAILLNEHSDASNPDHDPISAEAEWLGGWVRLMSTSVRRAGLSSIVGKTVVILYFDNQGNRRWFHLPMMKNNLPKNLRNT